MASTPAPSELPDGAVALLASLGLNGAISIAPLSGGANNRVFRISDGAQTVALKQYFVHPGDPRNRLDAEFRFLQFAEQRNVDCVPRPLARDDSRQLAVYEFIPGEPVSPGGVGKDDVAAALRFFEQLNPPHVSPDDAGLPAAAEACFSLEDHLTAVERRIERLSHLVATSKVEDAAVQFIKGRLQPAWTMVRAGIEANASVDLHAPLPARQRCVSPSDFGFHNALRRSDGAIFFLDFEYAGVDDPAKLLCDFFQQVAVPVPGEFVPLVFESLARATGEDESLARRAALLMPVYQLKWCAILLNEFLPVGGARRDFGRTPADDSRKKTQLQKAIRKFDDDPDDLTRRLAPG